LIRRTGVDRRRLRASCEVACAATMSFLRFVLGRQGGLGVSAAPVIDAAC
jgi:hypothetical protein